MVYPPHKIICSHQKNKTKQNPELETIQTRRKLTATVRGPISKVKVNPNNRTLMIIKKKKLEILHVSKEKDLHYVHAFYMENSGRI